jgi:hypothetical protein
MLPTSPRHLRHLCRLRQLFAERREVLGADAGASTVEVLGWAAMSTVAIVAIGAALQALGVDLVDYVRTQLGL